MVKLFKSSEQIIRLAACTVMLVFCAVCSIQTTVFGADYISIEGTDISYTIQDGVMTIKGTGALPDYNDQNGTAHISNKNDVTSLIIQEGITVIGEKAFSEYDDLRTVTLPQSIIRIDDQAFYSCSLLRKINIPKNVAKIGKNAFESCAIEEVDFDSKCSASIGDFAFSNCTSLTKVTLPDGISEIGESAFKNCSNLKNINIPSGITRIKSNTFEYCSKLEEIVIPENVKYIEVLAFGNCTGLSKAVVHSMLQYIGDGNDSFVNVIRDTSADSTDTEIVIKRYSDNATDNIYSGQLVYAEPKNTDDNNNYLYKWIGSGVNGAYGVMLPDTYVSSEIGTQAYSKYGSAYSASTSLQCEAYYINAEGRLIKAGVSEAITVTPANNSDKDTDISEIESSLKDIKVLMVEGESTPTLQQLLGRAGLMHVTCTCTYIMNNVTSSDKNVIEVKDFGRNASFTAKENSTGKSASISYGIYYSGCTFHGTQYSASEPYITNMTIEVVGASAVATEDSITLTLTGLPEGETRCTVEGGETKIVTPDKNTVTFDNLGENSNNRIFIVTPDGAQATLVDGMTPGLELKTVPKSEIPIIDEQPAGPLNWTYGDNVAESKRKLSVLARPSEATSEALTYQWYRAGSQEEQGELLMGEVNNDILIPDGVGTAAGEYWYYCIVSNKVEDNIRSVTSVRAEVTVDKAVLDIIPDDGQGKDYGSDDPEYTYTVNGLKGNDKAENTVTGRLSRKSGEDAGQYNYTLGTLAVTNDNYSLGLNASAPAFEIRKVKWEKPAAPELDKADITGIELKGNADFEYNIDGGNWQASPKFDNLKSDTEYSFTQRKKGDRNHLDSDSSDVAMFKTKVHTHLYEYSIVTNVKNGDTIKAACTNEDGGHEGNTVENLTISVADKVYDGREAVVKLIWTEGDLTKASGNESDGLLPVEGSGNEEGKAASYTDEDSNGKVTEGSLAFSGISEEKIVYSKTDGTVLDKAPVAAGEYIVSISVDDGEDASINEGVEETANKAADKNADPKVTASVSYRIEKARLTITPDEGQNKEYKGEDPILTYKVDRYGGNDDFSDMLTGKLSRATGENAGEYEITKGNLAAENYEIEFTEGVMFAINKRAITIKAKDQSVGVGGYIVNDSSQYDIIPENGLLDRHRIAAITLTADSTNEVTEEGVITPGDVTIEELPKKRGLPFDVTNNYDITFVNGVLTVSAGVTAVIECPKATAIDLGDTLEKSILSGGVASVKGVEIPGTFSWKNLNEKPELEDSESKEFIVVFTPEDTDNYTTAVCPVKVKVNPVAKESEPKTDKGAAKEDTSTKNNNSGTTPVNESINNKSINEATYNISKEQLAKNELALNRGLKISQTASKINIKWGKLSDADGYDVYVAYCGKKFSKKPTVTVKKNSVKVKKLAGKKIKLKKNFKVYVSAYKYIDNQKYSLGKTITGHVVGRKNSKYTNAKKIKLNKKKITVKVGKSKKIKAKTILVSKKKRQLSDAHAKEFRYQSSDKTIAKVSVSGKITGIKKGKCDVYVFSRNGYAKRIKVTVK